MHTLYILIKKRHFLTRKQKIYIFNIYFQCCNIIKTGMHICIYLYTYIFKLLVYIFSYTNIGKEFLNLISKHFPKNHQKSKIFNKNNMKVSYSCTDNLQTIIKKHNRKILKTSKTPSTENKCNCRHMSGPFFK